MADIPGRRLMKFGQRPHQIVKLFAGNFARGNGPSRKPGLHLPPASDMRSERLAAPMNGDRHRNRQPGMSPVTEKSMQFAQPFSGQALRRPPAKTKRSAWRLHLGNDGSAEPSGHRPHSDQRLPQQACGESPKVNISRPTRHSPFPHCRYDRDLESECVFRPQELLPTCQELKVIGESFATPSHPTGSRPATSAPESARRHSGPPRRETRSSPVCRRRRGVPACPAIPAEPPPIL